MKSRSIDDTLNEIRDDGLVLCLRLSERKRLVEACRAALRGGARVLEITLTSPGALDAIAELSHETGAIVGAGTVLGVADVQAVAAAGARFALSPLFDPSVVDAAHDLGLLAVPGAASPTEILTAHRHGARVVKVFPIGALGGPDYLRAVRGPFPDIPLLPTNGPNAENLADYFAAGAVAVGVGGDVFPPGFTLEEAEAQVRRLRQAREALRLRPAARHPDSRRT